MLFRSVIANQFKLFFVNGECVAFATLAYLSDDLSQKLKTEFIDPPFDSWSSGKNLWIIDMVAPNRGIEVTRDLQKTVFADCTEPGLVA